MGITNNEQWMQASFDDGEFYSKVISPLPDFWGVSRTGYDSNNIHMELGSGAHLIKHFKNTLDIVQPKNIFEIGLNVGYGSAIMLELCDANVVSIDISDRQETLIAANTLKEKYGDRFDFFLRKDDGWNRNDFYDLCFIDGGHDKTNAYNDILVCKEMGIPYLLFDDYAYQEGVREAVGLFPDLELVSDMYNFRLYKFTK